MLFSLLLNKRSRTPLKAWRRRASSKAHSSFYEIPTFSFLVKAIYYGPCLHEHHSKHILSFVYREQCTKFACAELYIVWSTLVIWYWICVKWRGLWFSSPIRTSFSFRSNVARFWSPDLKVYVMHEIKTIIISVKDGCMLTIYLPAVQYTSFQVKMLL